MPKYEYAGFHVANSIYSMLKNSPGVFNPLEVHLDQYQMHEHVLSSSQINMWKLATFSQIQKLMLPSREYCPMLMTNYTVCRARNIVKKIFDDQLQGF